MDGSDNLTKFSVGGKKEQWISLDDEIKNDVEEFANYFISRCINETYNDYVDRFRELYGEQAVKLSDVLDIEKGLGIPTVDGENTQQYIEWWLTILFDHIVNVKNKNYIDLSEMKNQFPFKYDNDQLKFPLSFELSLYLLNDNGNKKYVISPMLGSESKWKSFGRFGYLFNENIIGDDLNKKNKGFKEVEITFYPTKSHDANVAICNMNKSSYLELNTYETLNGKEKIDIDDIYMYIDKNSKISFVQGSTNEVLNFSTTNKYITNSFPDILKTIMEVDKKQKPCFESFFYALMKIIGNLSGHIPEIRYKNFIISQECWKIDNRKLFDNGKYLKYDDFVILINDMLITHEFPIEICTGPIDRKLILNMTKDTDMKILYKMLKENTNLAIYKNLFSIDNLILKNKNNEKYICEFVFQFEQKKVNNPELVYSSKRIPLIDNNFIDSVKYYPFNEWITINLYVNENIMDKLLINQIRYLFLSLMNDKSITSFFYIRYRDPKNHLRLRFKINNNYAAVIQEVNNLINILQERSLLNNLKYDVYVPEVNRYGGFDCYLLAEKVFYINSIISMNLIDMVDKKICVLSKEQIFLIGAYKMIQDMGINDVELLEYIKRYKLNKNLKNAYIEIGKDILPFFKKWSTNIDDMFHSSSELLNLYIELEKGKDAYRSYWLSINTIYNDNNFDNFIVKRYCLNSILHMFFNRLIGINRDVENVVMGVLEKIVHDKIQKEKMYGIK